MRFAPSVRQFGGRSVEGCLVISSTGMVGALAITKDGNSHTLITTTESLGSTRNRITSVDICYGKSKFFCCGTFVLNVEVLKNGNTNIIFLFV